MDRLRKRLMVFGSIALHISVIILSISYSRVPGFNVFYTKEKGIISTLLENSADCSA